MSAKLYCWSAPLNSLCQKYQLIRSVLLFTFTVWGHLCLFIGSGKWASWERVPVGMLIRDYERKTTHFFVNIFVYVKHKLLGRAEVELLKLYTSLLHCAKYWIQMLHAPSTVCTVIYCPKVISCIKKCATASGYALAVRFILTFYLSSISPISLSKTIVVFIFQQEPCSLWTNVFALSTMVTWQYSHPIRALFNHDDPESNIMIISSVVFHTINTSI